MTVARSSTAGPPTATNGAAPSAQPRRVGLRRERNRKQPPGISLAGRRRVRQRHDRVAGADLAAGGDVRPEPAPMDQPAQNPGGSEALEVRARLGEPATDALDAPDPEAVPDERVQADAARDDVPACLLPGDLDTFRAECLQRLGLDERQLVPSSVARERACTPRVAVTHEPGSGH